jgi:hypothetical protein
MNKILAALVVSLVFLTGCPGPVPSTEEVSVKPIGGNVAAPNTQYNFLSAFTTALPCSGVPLVWSIREQTTGWLPIDGSITQNGIWTSPACGSTWLGQQLHVDATCVATGKTASALIVTVPEQVTGVQIAYAVVTNPGQAACLSPTPTNPSVNPGGTIQFYARVLTTCGEIVTPTPPATWPALCP